MISRYLAKMNWNLALSVYMILLAFGLIVPFFNLVVPESSVFHMSTYTVTLLGKYMCYALLALALDLVWG